MINKAFVTIGKKEIGEIFSGSRDKGFSLIRQLLQNAVPWVKIDYFYGNFAIVSICWQKIFFQIFSFNGIFKLSKNVDTQKLTH